MTPFAIKLTHGSDIVRHRIPDVDKFDYNALLILCGEKLVGPDRAVLSLKFTDEDGDLCTISSTVELLEAFRITSSEKRKSLKIFVEICDEVDYEVVHIPAPEVMEAAELEEPEALREAVLSTLSKSDISIGASTIDSFELVDDAKTSSVVSGTSSVEATLIEAETAFETDSVASNTAESVTSDVAAHSDVAEKEVEVTTFETGSVTSNMTESMTSNMTESMTSNTAESMTPEKSSESVSAPVPTDESPTFPLHVQTIMGETIAINVKATDSIDSVKEKIATVTGVPVEAQTLFHSDPRAINKTEEEEIPDIVHTTVACDVCEVKPIVGNRFKCYVCDNFDLCAECEAKEGIHDESHPLIKLRAASQSMFLFGPHRYGRIFSGGHRHARGGFRGGRWRGRGGAGGCGMRGGHRGRGNGRHGEGGWRRWEKRADELAAKKVVSRPQARFIRGMSYCDGTVVVAGSSFMKTWRMHNDGKTSWQNIVLMHVGGDSMGAAPATPVPVVAPGAMADISIMLNAPEKVGRHCGYFRLSTKEGGRFGHRIWIDIIVQAVPVVVPVIPATPINSAPPVVERPTMPVTDAFTTPVVALPGVDALVTPSSCTVVEQWAAELSSLRAMGFEQDKEMLVTLLVAHNGNLNDVCASLLSV